MTYLRVSASWDTFLEQARRHFDVILGEAEDDCRRVFARAGFDPVPMKHAWAAIEHRVSELETKIRRTWHEEVDRALALQGVDETVRAHERAKSQRLLDYIEVERERTRIRIYADTARSLFEAGVRYAGIPACTRCTGTLTVPFTFRKLDIRCARCTEMNGYEPTGRRRLPDVFVHAICEEAAFCEWLEKLRRERDWRRANPRTIALLKAWERAEIAYLKMYIERRERILPHTVPRAELTGRMRSFYERVEREPAWISAGRPRELG